MNIMNRNKFYHFFENGFSKEANEKKNYFFKELFSFIIFIEHTRVGCGMWDGMGVTKLDGKSLGRTKTLKYPPTFAEEFLQFLV